MNFTIKTIIISIIFNLNMFGQSTEIQPYTLIKKIDSINDKKPKNFQEFFLER